MSREMDIGSRISIAAIILVLAILFCLSMAASNTGPSHGKVVVCYISTWAVYRPGNGAYSIENFNPSLCTHAIYAFAGLDIVQSAIKSLDPWQDLKEQYGKGGYERLTALKQTHPHLKVSLAIGGWHEGSKNYSALVANPELRLRFVKQATSFVRKYNFDGLDLDWEYPTQRGGAKIDRQNFVLLTKELREEFDKHNLLLTSAIGASKSVIDEAYDVRQISRYLDYLHIMCYDYHGSWDKKIGYNAPLKAATEDPLSVQFTIDYLLKLGAPKSKLVMGLPFYGRTFRTPFDGRLAADAEGAGFQGPYTREDGFLGYNEICNLVSNMSSGWSTQWDAETSQVLAFSQRDTSNGQVLVVTYDSERSIANKVRFAMHHDLAGVMIWSIDTDDFRGECSMEENIYADFNGLQTGPQRSDKKYPLMQTVNEAINLSLNEIMEQDQHHKHLPDDSENEIPHGSIENHKSGALSTKLMEPIIFSFLLLQLFLFV